jgi:hypothetical protein
MKDKKKSPDELPGDWFWQILALVGSLTSIAGLIATLSK